MSTIKIYPPTQLPAEGVTDVQFKIWKEELEVYLEIEEKFRKFLPGGRYQTWTSAEINEDRVTAAITPDTEAKLPDIKRELRQFITIIAKYVHQDYYNPIVRHSTSLEWIYKKLREDYDIQQQGIHFLNLLDLSWDPTGQMTPIGFYNSYRSMIIGNLGKKNDNIQWQNSKLPEDEKMTPSHEDLVLLNVLQLIHPKLPSYVRDHYAHKIGQEKRLMDFKTEILSKAKTFIQEIDAAQMSHIDTEEEPAQCNYAASYSQPKRNNIALFRPRKPFNQPRPYRSPVAMKAPPIKSSTKDYDLPPFCRVCQIAGLPRSIYTSHYLGDQVCKTLSDKDKNLLTVRTASQLNALSLSEEDTEANIAAEYGYQDEDDQQQVECHQQHQDKYGLNNIYNDNNIFSSDPRCNFIQPIPSQTLTVMDANKGNVHLDLDSGATVSYAKLSAVLAHNFKIKPNDQLSRLADGKTKMPAIGEIDEIFHRNNWQVKFRAIVTKDLHCDFVAGNNFLKDNAIIQDISNKTITVNKKYTVHETNKALILPTCPTNSVITNNNINVLYPGHDVTYKIEQEDASVVAVQPWFQNKCQDWPQPQLCEVKNGHISINNNTERPIILKKESPQVQIITTNETLSANNFPKHQTKHTIPMITISRIDEIQINKSNIDKMTLDYIDNVHKQFEDIFDENLTMGYNMKYGKHICHLNWADHNRPPANKIHNINYDHDTKVLLQQVCDNFTDAGVLGIPQEHDIQIQHVSPAFLVRKQRAKNKPKDQLTVNDVRLVVNFGKINDYLKNIPIPVTKPKDIFTQLGKWKYIITMDLYQGFFQNHMSLNDGQWLGICTPFGGLRFLRRSGQGLLGQSEELDELLAKVLGKELEKGIAARIADDLYIGGQTPFETATNYAKVLEKLHAANLKISASKTKLFLAEVDVLGWHWKQGGFLAPSPHRTNALKNTKTEDIKNVKDMRSWLGLYKTLLPASKNLTILLDPFDKLTADRQSKEPFIWDRDLESQFKIALEAVDKLQTLYLPHPDDQLMIVVDAAKTIPGLGHTLYAIKDNKKLPVSFHSVKLSKTHANWLPCELEALAFATAITAEYNIIKESKLPVILSPDSKSVADAVNLIKKGHFSVNPRIQTMITNVNRVPIIIQMANGKNNLNQCGDFQSRHPSVCSSEHCAICSFVNEKSNATLDPFAINAISTSGANLFSNKSAWNKIQDEQKACREAKFLLKTGKTPSKQSGKVYSEIRRLCSIAKLNKDNLLYVPSRQNKFSSQTTELIIVPSNYLPALLWQLHNNLHHPTKSQLKAQFDKSFYSVGLTSELETIYDNCYFCATQKKLPMLTEHFTKTEVNYPGLYFHADVIRRQSQYILTVRDHFSSLTAAKIIRAENSNELKKGIIDLVMPIKLTGSITVKVDNATGFKPLLENKDPDLCKLNIAIVPTDCFNKNENAVVDKACFELEQALKSLEPDGRPISQTTLHMAVNLLNKKLRRSGQISAFEMHFNRDMNTGSNLNLDYSKIREDQLKVRHLHNVKHNEKVFTHTSSSPSPGDIVAVKTQTDKHKARDTFVVTATKDDKVNMRKIIHPFTSAETNIRSKVYSTNKHYVFVTKKNVPEKALPNKKVNCQTWNPIRIDEYMKDPTEYISQDNSEMTADLLVPDSLQLQSESVDIDNEPQSTTTTSKFYCPICRKEVTNTSVQCTSCKEWLHVKCSGLKKSADRKKYPQWQGSCCNTPATIPSECDVNLQSILPQLDGQLSEPSSANTSSKESSPLSHKDVLFRRSSSTDANFIDVSDTASDTSSLQWDTLEDNLNLSSHDPDSEHNLAFSYPILNLTASPSSFPSRDRVHKFHRLLEQIPEVNLQQGVPRKRNRFVRFTGKVLQKCKKHME